MSVRLDDRTDFGEIFFLLAIVRREPSLKKLGDFTVAEGHGHPLVYIYIYIYTQHIHSQSPKHLHHHHVNKCKNIYTM